MHIYRKNIPKFGDIYTGQFFIGDGELCLKLDDLMTKRGTPINCINVYTGDLFELPDDYPIENFIGTIEIEEGD